jgi:cytochrome c-type biogenesis protein CcsB
MVINIDFAESFLGNWAFGVLFLSMLVYWFQAAFFNESKNWGGKLKFLGFSGIFVANLLLAALLIFRWKESHHFPLSNLYESLIFLTWGISFVHLFIEKRSAETYLGVIFSPILLFIDAFATLTLPAQMQESAPLVPALKSNWLMMHVSIMMLSYATLIAGSLMAIAFLMISTNQGTAGYVSTEEVAKAQVQKNTEIGGSRLPSGNLGTVVPLDQTLDNLSYRTLGIGFPLLTLGILSGAIWANEAWGSYWSWDPKETWALITWFVFAIYFHFRLTWGWKGKKPAIVASIGFVLVWVCYLGVNLLGSGLHSYGWLKV